VPWKTPLWAINRMVTSCHARVTSTSATTSSTFREPWVDDNAQTDLEVRQPVPFNGRSLEELAAHVVLVGRAVKRGWQQRTSCTPLSELRAQL
jgi:hypothetical protein